MTNPNADFYKQTVFLPKTEFPMRGDLPQREPEILKFWQSINLYQKLRDVGKNKPKFTLHDGPPYANGNIHMGHAMNKVLKDAVLKSYSMLGYDTPYTPGWDCHGLPIEWKIEEQYRAAGKDKDAVDPIVFRAECREFAKKWVDIQSSEFQRLGVIGDWDNPYLTMTNKAEAQIAREIHKFVQNGGLYKGVKPVLWSAVEKTALAEAEVEYHEHKSIAVWVKFPIIKSTAPILNDASIVIWTTTPWTLPSNRAVAFGNLDYALYQVKQIDAESKCKIGEKLLLSKKLSEDLKKMFKVIEWDEVVSFDARAIFEMEIICAHPLHTKYPELFSFNVPLLKGDFVTDDTGTGFVHISPSHGKDDYDLYFMHFGAEDIPDNITDDGKFRAHLTPYAGLSIFNDKGEPGDANFAVLKDMNEIGVLLAKGSVRHEYPHSWRSKAPLIFRTTPQWFIGMEKNNLRETALKAIADTKWVPAQGENRIRAMIEQRPDWCISRQRAWGVPIALFVNKQTGDVLKDDDVFARIGDIFEKEGADAWFSRPPQDFLGNGYTGDDYDQVFDIVDVWFESGSTHSFVMDGQQSDLYLEGSDQHRGWFHSSLLESCGTRGRAPFRAVLTHGFVLDEKGYKMSKSLGNVVAPQDIMDKYGADILRLWVLSSDYAEDIRVGAKTLDTSADMYRRIRNTFRYLLGALDGYTESEATDLKNAPELERYMLHRLAQIDLDIKENIQKYNFSKMIHAIHHFCAVDLSAFYFDIRKDRLYCDRPDLPERMAYRTVMATILDALVKWLAPIIPFTAEEAWKIFGGSKVESVHLNVFADCAQWLDHELTDRWDTIRDIRKEITATLEPKRADKTIGSSLEAHPVIYLPQTLADKTKGIDWAEIAITSQATVKIADTLKVEFQMAEGKKCQRCWKVLPDVGTDPDYPDLSARDADAVRYFQQHQKAA